MKRAFKASWLCAVFMAMSLLVAGCSANMAASQSQDIVLVAGATGGTGRALVRDLSAQGYSVRALVRDEDKARVVLGDDIDYALGDVREIDTLLVAVDGVSFVISVDAL